MRWRPAFGTEGFEGVHALDTGHAYIYPALMVDTVLRVFQYVPPLIAVTDEDWQKFCAGTIPLQAELPAPRIHILAVTLLATPMIDSGENVCRSIEPFLVDVDASGYLVPKYATLAPLNAAASSVIDLRPRLLARYLRHAYVWSPPAHVLSEALKRSLASVAHPARISLST